MSDHSELKKAALRVVEIESSEGESISDAWEDFESAANPAAVLALIAEVEGFRAQHGRDSAELRSLCQARDDARKDRDQLKAEVARSTEREIMQLAEIEVLRKDAERYRWLRNGSDYSVAVHEGPELDKVIDRAMSEAAKP